MRKIMLATVAVLSMGAGAVSTASAGDALSPAEMNAFLQKDQAARQSFQEHYRQPYDVETTGSIAAPGAVNGPNELWPPCMAGPPACTAAGYPNLRYMREIQGGY